VLNYAVITSIVFDHFFIFVKLVIQAKCLEFHPPPPIIRFEFEVISLNSTLSVLNSAVISLVFAPKP